jgi:hypothetical protein
MGHISFWLTLTNLLRDNIDTIKKSTETLIDASKVVGPEINLQKTKYMFYLITRMQDKIGT